MQMRGQLGVCVILHINPSFICIAHICICICMSTLPSCATPTTVSCLKHNPSYGIHCETNLKFAARQPNYTNDIRSARQTKGSFRLCMCVCVCGCNMYACVRVCELIAYSNCKWRAVCRWIWLTASLSVWQLQLSSAKINSFIRFTHSLVQSVSQSFTCALARPFNHLTI